MFKPEIVKMLADKLDKSHVKTRSQSGRALSYIEGWYAIAEANRIFGFDQWTRETVETRLVAEKPRKIGQTQKDGWSVSYIAKVRVTVMGIVREGVGAGHGIDVDLGLAHESAIKEAETDAMKRALMTFGNPFGLALYDKDQKDVGEPVDESLVAYIDNCIEKIDSFASVDEAREWWKAEASNRQSFGLTKAQSDNLTARITARFPKQKEAA